MVISSIVLYVYAGVCRITGTIQFITIRNDDPQELLFFAVAYLLRFREAQLHYAHPIPPVF